MKNRVTDFVKKLTAVEVEKTGLDFIIIIIIFIFS